MEATESSRSSKRRKTSHRDVDEENDDEKMDKFYALIRNIREVRELLNRAHAFDKEENQGKKWKLDNPDAWTPSFRPEDFKDEAVRLKMAPPIDKAGSSQSKEDGEKEGLDLRLSL